MPGQQDCKMAVVWVLQLLREYLETSIDAGFIIKLACISNFKHVRYSFGKNIWLGLRISKNLFYKDPGGPRSY